MCRALFSIARRPERKNRRLLPIDAPTASGSTRQIPTTSGPTNLLTTVEDLFLWDQNFYEPKVGGPDLVKQLQQKGKLNNGEEIFYALGLGIESTVGSRQSSTPEPTRDTPPTFCVFPTEVLGRPDVQSRRQCTREPRAKDRRYVSRRQARSG